MSHLQGQGLVLWFPHFVTENLSSIRSHSISPLLPTVRFCVICPCFGGISQTQTVLSTKLHASNRATFALQRAHQRRHGTHNRRGRDQRHLFEARPEGYVRRIIPGDRKFLPRSFTASIFVPPTPRWEKAHRRLAVYCLGGPWFRRKARFSPIRRNID